MMFASFHSNGTTPSSNAKLNTVASGVLICSTISSSNLGGIRSALLLWYISLLKSDTMLSDNVRPEFTECPVVVRVTVGRFPSNAVATWPIPVVTDNVDTFIIPYPTGWRSGDIFWPGVHEVTYTATDAEFNEAFPCTFIVVVTGW